MFYGMGNPFVKSFPTLPQAVCRRITVATVSRRPAGLRGREAAAKAWFAAFGEDEILDAANAAERDMIQQIKQEKRDQEERRVKAFDDMIREARGCTWRRGGDSWKDVDLLGRPHPRRERASLRDENADPNKPAIVFPDGNRWVCVLVAATCSRPPRARGP